jgi:Zn-finger nucleic acid-binding protein
LEEQQVDTITARFCAACNGMLLKHTDLVNVIEQSWRFVPEKTARFTDFHTKDTLQKEPQFLCPDCHKPMEKYGYMGYAAIPIDRCDGCALLWLDSDELQNIVLALAKSKYRVERTRKAEREAFDTSTVGVALAASGRQIWLFEEEAVIQNAKAMAADRGTALALKLLLQLLRL